MSTVAELLDKFRKLDEELVEHFNKDTEQMGADYDDRIRFLEERTLLTGSALARLMEVLSERTS